MDHGVYNVFPACAGRADDGGYADWDCMSGSLDTLDYDDRDIDRAVDANNVDAALRLVARPAEGPRSLRVIG